MRQTGPHTFYLIREIYEHKKSPSFRQTVFVPEAGLEPAYLSAHAPETCVSTSSTIPVWVAKL